MVSHFNPEMKRPLVTLSKRINHQRAIFLTGISEQLSPSFKLLLYFVLDWMIDYPVCCIEPYPSESREFFPWIWIVKRAGDHHTGTNKTFNWGGNLDAPRGGLSLKNWRKKKYRLLELFCIKKLSPVREQNNKQEVLPILLIYVWAVNNCKADWKSKIPLK